ncbi:pilus assembly protein TadG-related protein [Paludisphaera soli]|uniref:pilus assembly protein TadG-related protein n=1 Tax=Paludisphaera soli TaxID=2712865 RepID=UPI0013EB9B3A|nr:pilus assembly protein TadG-related protein [Paludisphaera soli]
MIREGIRDRDELRRGAVAVVAAVSMIPLVGVLALVLDAGLLMAERRRAQSAADAASFAAVCAYQAAVVAADGQSPQAAATAAALDYAAANGYSSGADATVTVQSPPSPSRYAGKAGAFQVLIVSHQPRLFSAIWEGGDVDVAASSVSYAKPTAPPSVVLLNTKDQASLSIVGGARLTAPGEVQVKSNHLKAATVNNTGYIKAPVLRVGGGLDVYSSGVIASGTSTQTWSDPAAITDPQASLARPTDAGLTTRQSPSGWNPVNPFPIYPGVYENGLNLNAGGMKYTMNPGVYYIRNGDFSIVNGVRATGDGVMIYLDNGNVNIQGGDGITLNPPKSGPYQGVSIFQRSDKSPVTGDYTPRTISVANGTNNKIGGVIYAPGATANFAGGSSNTYGTQLIVNKLNLSNNAMITLPAYNGPVNVTYHLVE